MDAIANYAAVWFEGRYRFDLLADAIHIVGTTYLQSNQDVTLPLAGLQVRVDRFSVRSGYFWHGLLMLNFGYIAY